MTYEELMSRPLAEIYEMFPELEDYFIDVAIALQEKDTGNSYLNHAASRRVDDEVSATKQAVQVFVDAHNHEIRRAMCEKMLKHELFIQNQRRLT